MERIVEVKYRFKIKYETLEHFDAIVKELIDHPIKELQGCGIATDGAAYCYSCDRIGKGEILDKHGEE